MTDSRPVVSVREAFELQREGALIVDVREPFEFELSHIADSVLIPFGRIVEAAPDLPLARAVLLFCRTGRRSGIAQIALMNGRGLCNLFNVEGGIVAWEAAKLPLVRCEDEAFCYLSYGIAPRRT